MPSLRTLPTVFATLSQLRMSYLKLKDRQQQPIHAVYNRNVVFFFAKFWPCLFVIISFLTIGMAYLVVRRDVEPGSLLTLHKVFVGER